MNVRINVNGMIKAFGLLPSLVKVAGKEVSSSMKGYNLFIQSLDDLLEATSPTGNDAIKASVAVLPVFEGKGKNASDVVEVFYPSLNAEETISQGKPVPNGKHTLRYSISREALIKRAIASREAEALRIAFDASKPAESDFPLFYGEASEKKARAKSSGTIDASL